MWAPCAAYYRLRIQVHKKEVQRVGAIHSHKEKCHPATPTTYCVWRFSLWIVNSLNSTTRFSWQDEQKYLSLQEKASSLSVPHRSQRSRSARRHTPGPGGSPPGDTVAGIQCASGICAREPAQRSRSGPEHIGSKGWVRLSRRETGQASGMGLCRGKGVKTAH